jgi:hypothetical protein
MRPAIPNGLVAAVVLIALVEAYVRVHDRYFITPPGWEWQWNSRAARREAPKCDILCFGDSLSKLGVLPRAIEARTGYCGYNLAGSGSQAPAHYFLLRQALDAGAKPRAVLVNYLPQLLTAKLSQNLEVWPYLLSLRECAELAWHTRDATLFGTLLCARLVPSVKYRFPIRAGILGALKGQRNIMSDHSYISARQWRVNRGAIPTAGRRPNLPSTDQWGKACFADYSCSTMNGSYIKRFLALAQERGIRVYWLIVPIEPDLQAWCHRTGFEEKQTRFLHALQAEFPNLFVIDGRAGNYDPRVFWDLHHLGKQGAVAYSTELGNILRQHLARGRDSSRWIDLPEYRVHRADFTLEEYDESSVALREGRPVR